MASRVDLSFSYPTVSHHMNGFFTISIVLPYYSCLQELNIRMLIAIVTICTLQLFLLTLILAR
jgi:hypothetical protein